MGIPSLALAFALGCREPDPPPDPPETDTSETGTPSPDPADTGTSAELPPFAATCVPQPNPLRFDCTIHVDPPQPVSVTFAPTDGSRPARTHRSPDALADHVVGLYLMAPETAYTWTAAADDPDLASISGTVTTGALPEDLARIHFEVDGTSTAALLGFADPCANQGVFAVVADPASSEILWYHDLSMGQLAWLDAVSFTDEGTVLAIVSGGVYEVEPTGRLRMVLVPGTDLPFRTHHDVFRRGSRTYALFSERALFHDTEYLMDGFYVIEDGAVIGEWHLSDHVVPPPSDEPGFSVDWSHANSVWVDDDGEALVSLRHQSAVMQVEADPAAPDFGAVRWTVAAPGSDLPSDLALGSEVGPPEDFQQQHNVFLLPDGTMTLFDNRLDLAQHSRVLELRLDAAGGAATITRAFELPQHCPYQGGALRTAAGNPLATCAPTSEAFEFDAATGDPVFHAAVTCGEAIGRYIPRFVPVSW